MKKLGFFSSFYNNILYFNDQDTCITIYIDDFNIVKRDFFLINKLKE